MHPNNSPDEITATAEKVRIDTFPQIIDTSGKATAHFGLISHPSLMLIDAEGNKTLSSGTIEPMSTLEAVKALVASSPSA